MLRRDRVYRVVHGALNHPHVDLARRRCPSRRRWEGGDCARRDLVPMRYRGGVRCSGWFCGRCTDDAERSQQHHAPDQLDRLRVMPSPSSVTAAIAM